MACFDVFNGDADGICALHQLRLAQPLDSQLITGVKRNINLLKQVQAEAGDKLTVLDISLDKNRDDLIRLLNSGAEVLYFDHHFAGDIPQFQNLTTHINTDANVCSSLLVNEYLKGKYLHWAVTAAFGDNLFDSAVAAARPLSLSEDELTQLKQLGACINYNGYGSTLSDLIFDPAELYGFIQPYENPFDFINADPAYKTLLNGYQQDMDQVNNISPRYQDEHHAVFVLPDEKWARRVSGVYANDLAQQFPQRAHAILTEKSDSGFVVSVRAPLNNKTGADELCRKFETGGGRKAAAGINYLPENDYDRFVDEFKKSFT